MPPAICSNPGLAALFRKAGLGGPVTPYHFGFLIGPRINAGGRIGDAALGSRLLTLDEENVAEQIAARLDELNRERQAMETAMLAEAEAEALAEYGNGEMRLRSSSPRGRNWHPGIVGPAGGAAEGEIPPSGLCHRLRSQSARERDRAGRSAASTWARMVRAAVDAGLLVKGGGHAMAAGLTVERGQSRQAAAFLRGKG